MTYRRNTKQARDATAVRRDKNARARAKRAAEHAFDAASDEERAFRTAYQGDGRFVLAECEGYTYDNKGISVVVLDRAYCFRTVAQYRTENSGGQGAAWTREQARRLAAELEWKYAR